MSLFGLGIGIMLANFHMWGIMFLLRAAVYMLVTKVSQDYEYHHYVSKVATCFLSVAFAFIIVSVHSHISILLYYQACSYYIISS